MELYEGLMTRRSIRHFTQEHVSDELVEKLLRAAMQAPSAANAQPWHYVVINDRLLLEKVTEFHPAAESLHEAPMAILICGDSRLEKRPDRWMQDCSAATQNMLLAAHSLGLGAVWLGIHPDPIRIDNIRIMLGLPGHVHPLSLVAFGFPGRTLGPVDRFHPDRIHHNHW